MLKYTQIRQTFREVPDEISLCFSISNCPLKCPQCHSPELQTDVGEELTKEVLDKAIKENENSTCITFLGHGSTFNEILDLLKYCKELGFKTCLYTGLPLKNIPDIFNGILDYIKVGPYIPALGGLDSPRTNQKFYKIQYLEDSNTSVWVDHTDEFWL